MATGREWTRWHISVAWEPDVAPDLKDRLDAFLTVVLTRVASLAVRLDGALDVDVLAALSGVLSQVERRTRPDTDLMVAAVHLWGKTLADETAVAAWQRVIEQTCVDDAVPVQWVTVGLLLERVCRALLASRRHEDMEDVLETAADALEAGTRCVLSDVLAHHIAANLFRSM
jgi:hypothetical protein